ncbi:LysR family transcriptional regulator [Marinobacter halodurans]|uniref:LysR family transcriptional regulator n=1 Tax=Marinobacter halodurans TaxID=2528979 RepID=A0ABY1ZKJ9_9GAMM|nr:LysR family transcriptional regulator [Marinobacter halodurans]TBW53336.1 LysR family transcriptional regulator [Marinobacter halodurans]
MKLPSLNAVRFFEASARRQSFKVAAEELNVGPTAVSHQIRKLEEWLGVDLFHREVSGVTLTPDGQELYGVASRAMRELSEVVARIRQDRSVLTIRTTSSFASLWLLPRLEVFHENVRSTELEIVSGEVAEIRSRERINELSIRFGDITNIDPDLVLTREQYNLYGSPAYIESNVDVSKGLAVFVSKWKNPGLPRVPIEAFRETNALSDELIKESEFDQELFGVQQAIAGRGLVFASKTLCDHLVRDGLLVESRFLPVDSRLGFYLNEGADNKGLAAIRFIEWIKSAIA